MEGPKRGRRPRRVLTAALGSIAVLLGGASVLAPTVSAESGFAWNHGDVSPDVTTTWLGFVGPGVKHLGVDDTLWSDHADDRPTQLALLGLKDDYRHEGRVLAEILDPSALHGGFGNLAEYERLGRIFKQIDASVGQFGLATLQASTRALESGAGGNDSQYTQVTAQLQQLGAERDQLAGQMQDILDRPVSTAGGGRAGDARALEDRGLDLLQQAWLLAGM